MRIVESDIHMNSSREAEFRESREIRSATSFRTIYQGFQASQGETAEAPRERLARMLQALADAILAAMNGKNCRCPSAAPPEEPLVRLPQGPTREMAWDVEITRSVYDYERTRVEGAGVVKTADGRSIDFSLQAEFCREYSCTTEFRDSGKVVLTDPIVLNFDGKAAELTGERISFDLDADGSAEWLPGLGSGSGYLVLDRNGNGKVDDGKELFGPGSGNGFADLAALDDDDNGWLDEGDAAFTRLGLWDGRPEDAAQDLASREVGAIWLGSVDSPFAIKDEGNALLGEIRAAGLYLREDGSAGLVAQVDLARQGNGPVSPEPAATPG